MNWLFGRKAAPDSLRPFVPAWLRGGVEEEGFARSDRRAAWRSGRVLRRCAGRSCGTSRGCVRHSEFHIQRAAGRRRRSGDRNSVGTANRQSGGFARGEPAGHSFLGEFR